MPPRRSASVGRFSRFPPGSTRAIPITKRQPSPASRLYSRNKSSFSSTKNSSTVLVAQDEEDIENTTGSTCPDFGELTILSGKSIKSFNRLVIPPNIKSIDLSHNLITDFVGFHPGDSLETLNLSYNPIKSLRGFPNLLQISGRNASSAFTSHGLLKNISLNGSPFAKNQFYRIALIIVIGEKNVRTIDGERVTAAERRIAATYGPEFAQLLRSGWQITYPAPPKSELPKIKAQIAESLRGDNDTQYNVSGSNSRTATLVMKSPVIKRKVKAQSKIYEDNLNEQKKEIDELSKEIQKLEAQIESQQNKE